MAVSSFLDDYDNDMPSIVHMKNRVSTVLDSYYKMYPELSALLPEDTEKIANEIYDIYSHTGIFIIFQIVLFYQRNQKSLLMV